MDFSPFEYPKGGIFDDRNEATGVSTPDQVTRGKNLRFGSRLVKITKCQSTPENKGFEQDRLKRLSRFALQEIAGKLLVNHRVNYCLRHRISKDTGVKVMYNPVREKAHYSNLVRCGSVWVCPVCSAKIAEERKQELKTAMSNWRKQGGHVYLLTLTNRHHAGDNLKQLLEGQKKALAYLWGNRSPKEMLKNLGKQGHVIATEVTYGENGWHPHYHILLFMRHEVNIQGLQSFLATEWQNCCKRAGLAIPTREHGVNLQDGSYADSYVTKWGLEDEMTKGHIKKGREGGLTPFDLLRQSVECPEYGKLFKVFVEAFKGKRQLHWSRGLKALLCVDERTDEELAEETDKVAYQYDELDEEIWYLVSKYRNRGEFLEAVEDDIKLGSNRVELLVMKLASYEVEQIRRVADTS